jgi:hypothetical protein
MQNNTLFSHLAPGTAKSEVRIKVFFHIKFSVGADYQLTPRNPL